MTRNHRPPFTVTPAQRRRAGLLQWFATVAGLAGLAGLLLLLTH